MYLMLVLKCLAQLEPHETVDDDLFPRLHEEFLEKVFDGHVGVLYEGLLHEADLLVELLQFPLGYLVDGSAWFR